MKALAIKQPWAWLIAAGHKDIENRSWNTKFRGRFYIHASLKPDQEAFEEDLVDEHFHEYIKFAIDKCAFGAIIGEAEITGTVYDSDSEWYIPNSVGFMISGAKLYAHPIPWKGQLGFFNVDDDELELAHNENMVKLNENN